MGKASIKTFRCWSTGTKGNGTLPFVRQLFLDDERDGLEIKYHRQTKRHVVKVNNFLLIFILHITMIVLLSQKQELTNKF
jgi:hypothetical protein